MNGIRSIVSFTVEIPDAEPDRLESSLILIELVKQAIVSLGAVAENLQPLDYAQHVNIKLDGKAYYVMCGYVGDELRQWMVSVDRTRGFIDTIFGKRGIDDSDKAITSAIHKALNGRGATNIRWYTVKDWNANAAEAYSATP